MTYITPCRDQSPHAAHLHDGMAAFLRWMTLAAGLIILAGGVIYLMRDGHNTIHSFYTFSGQPASLRLFPQIVSGALHGNGLQIIQSGILLLIATPVLRVAFAGVNYMLERDWLYVTVACIVLAILLTSLLWPKL